MKISDIAQKIVSILDVDISAFTAGVRSALLKSGKLYFGTPPKFTQDQVELLLKLESTIDNLNSREFFWHAIGWPILYPQLTEPKDRVDVFEIPITNLTGVLHNNPHICFLTYLIGNRIDDALDGLIGKWSQENAPLISIEPRIIGYLIEVLDNEPHLFKRKHFDKIEKCIWACTNLLATTARPQGPGLKDVGLYKEIDIRKKLLDSLTKSFQKARYKLTKEELENIEINRDKELVQREIERFGFPPDLVTCLNRIDESYYKARDEFQFKETIGHIRSFLDLLIQHVADKVVSISGIQPSETLDRFGKRRSYLKQKEVGFLNTNQDQLSGGIWAFLSDSKAGVHALKSEREYARLAKNIAIEWALFLFRRLDRYPEVNP